MIIADRGFDNLWTLVDRKFHGSLAANLFKFGSGGWQCQNAYNYLKSSDNKCYKVVMCDKNDEIVLLQTSQMVGIANEVFALKTDHDPSAELLSKEMARQLAENILKIQNLDHLIHEIMIEVERKIDLQLEEEL